MAENNPETPKEWEKFDEISLKNLDVTVVNEENESKEVKDEKKEEIAEEQPKEDPKDDVKEDLDKQSEVKEEPKPKVIVPPRGIPKIPVSHSEPATERRIPRIPLAPHPLPPKKSEAFEKLEQLEKIRKLQSTETPPPIPEKPEKPEKKVKSSEAAFLDVVKLEEGRARIAKASAISNPQHVNGKVLATVYPDNVLCDWITPPHYDPHTMPSILAIDVPTLPGEDYVAAVEIIIKDSRFKMFSTIYARMIAIWMTLWIFSLAVTLLLQSKGGWPVMIWCLVWAVLLFAGVYVCAMIRRRIRIGLNHVVEKANKIVVDRHFLVGVEDRGQLSCHKTVIHFIRFNAAECTADVIRQLKIRSSGGCVFGGRRREEENDESIEREAAALILEYSQEYVKSVVKKRLIFPSKPAHGVSSYAPKHCKTQMCLCQFIDDRKFNAKQKKWYERYI